MTENLTFKYQSTLPRLPIPELKQTLDIYKKSLKPVLTEKEFEESIEIIDGFCEKEGKELQKRLINFDKLQEVLYPLFLV